jgi:peroxiredoxin
MGGVRSSHSVTGDVMLQTILALGTAALMAARVSDVQEKESPKKLPEFTLKTADGAPFALKYEQGQVVVEQNKESSKPKALFIHFFQPDCNLCMAEMKALETLHQEVTKQGALIVGVAHRHDEAAVRGIREKLKISYPLLLGRGSELASQFSRGDASILVDGQGMVRSSQVSYKEGEEKLWKENIERLLAEMDPTPAAAKREKPLEVGDKFPAVKAPSLLGGKGMSMAVEDGKLTFRDKEGRVTHPKAAIGFFSRY